MIDRQVPILTLFIAAIAVPCAQADDKLSVAAQPAEAIVAPRASDSKLVDLPALDVRLHASLGCSGNAESLTVSVADAVTTLGTTELAEQTSAEASLTVPARQVALAASSHFCLQADPSSANELTVAGLATVHASLRCLNDNRSSAHFASAPLQVRLICAREAPEAQEPSPER